MKNKSGFLKALSRFFKGIIIGGGAILPGVSGGVLCVLFGIYRPMMELLAHPVRAIRKNLWLFIPVILGWGAGFLIFAKALDFIFTRYELFATCLFVGLIGGTVPGLYRQAGKDGRKKSDLAAMAAAFTALLAILAFARFGGVSAGITPNLFWYFFCGVLWGLSLVVPGMSSSSILLSLGLYQPMTAGIADLDLLVLLPWGVGLLATALLLGRLVNHLFETKYSLASHMVCGIVLASTLIIIPLDYGTLTNGLICALCCALGVACAYLMDKFEITGD